jgi:hypothetical protein
MEVGRTDSDRSGFGTESRSQHKIQLMEDRGAGPRKQGVVELRTVLDCLGSVVDSSKFG